MTEATHHPRTGEQTGGDRPARHYHHGRTPAAWAGTTLAFVGILVGGIGMIPTMNWIVFSIGAVLFVAGGLTAVVLRKLGLGAD